MKKILYSIIAMLGIFSASSCGDMLETDNDSMVIDPALDSKTDSVFYALGIAHAMQQLADQYFFVGEMRGELVSTTTSTNTHLRNLADYSATTDNKYDSAYVYYKVINNCNYYLTHRDTSNLYTGAINVSINEYAAVAAWRAWAYLQLARTYCGNENRIPFFTHPLTTISQINEGNLEKKNLKEIVAALAPSLERFSGLTVPTFSQNNLEIGSMNWSSSTKKNINMQKIFVPVDVILGEMYLEAGEYPKAARYYAKYLCDNKLTSNDYTASFRSISAFNSVIPDDFGDYNQLVDRYTFSIFANQASPSDVLSYIPMASSSQYGQTTEIPMAFGFDYYSTSSSNYCPRLENVQLVPSKTYYGLTDSCAFYYYPKNVDPTHGNLLYPNDVKSLKIGDGRANVSSISNSNRDYPSMLNRDNADTTKVYIRKAQYANIYLFRTSTIYLHLAEALNRMEYPELAFAILRNGISTYLEGLVPGDTPLPHQYMTQKGVDLLRNTLYFLNATNREVFVPSVTFGIHQHGGGFELRLNTDGAAMEDGHYVYGSCATAVGSEKNLMYLPTPIIGEKMQELSKLFPDIALGATLQDSINAMEDILCDEYAKEFAFEGVRFYDLQRMARHKNESGIYGGNFGSRWFAKKLEGNTPQVSLLEPKNWYLPFE